MSACSVAIQQMSRYVTNLKYTDTLDKALQLRRAFLLSNPASLMRSITGKTTLEGLQRASDPLAAGLDSILAHVTGERTKGTQSVKEFAASLKGAVRTAKQIALTGVNPNGPTTTAAVGAPTQIGNAFLDTWSEITYRAFDAETNAFRQLAVERSLADQSRAIAANEGLTGPARAARVADLQQNPNDQMALQAAHDADYVTLQNPNLFSEAVAGVSKGKEQAQAQLQALQQQRTKLQARGQPTNGPVLGALDLQIRAAQAKVTRASVVKGAVGYVAPFPKVPTNAGLRYLDYSPAGVFLTLARQLTNPSQRGLVEDLSRNLTGGALAMLGWALYENHLATGLSPDEAGTKDRSSDASEVPNGARVGNEWVDLTKIGPAGGVIGVGARLHRLAEQAHTTALGALPAEAPAILGQGLAESPLSEGGDLAQAITEHQPTDLGRLAGGVVSGAIPNVLQAATRGSDVERQTTGTGFGDTALNQIKAGLPGLRQQLPPRLDTFGQTIQTGPGGPLGAIDRMIDPLRYRQAKDDRVAAELDNHGLAPPKLSGKTKANGPVLGPLSPEGMTTYRRGEGADLHNALARAIASPVYLTADHATQTRILKQTERAVQAAWRVRKQALASPLHVR